MDVRIVGGTRDLGLVRGATGAHFVECDDGRKYVVKFADSSRAAINDFLGHVLGRAIGLPVPDNTLVEIDEEMIAGSDDMRNRGISPGLHHGSGVITHSIDLGTVQEPGILKTGELCNAGSLPGTVCLDNWILTEDRDRADNHLLQTDRSGFRYFMMDFTHSFTGPRWTADTLDEGTFLRMMMPVLPAIAECVRGNSSFQPTLQAIESMPDSDIEDVVAAVPARWGMTEEERGCLIHFLVLRRGLVRAILETNRVVFPNWSK